MKCFNRIEKVSADEFMYGSDMHKMLALFGQTLSRNHCDDSSEFISIEKLIQCQVIYISIGGWEYEVIFDLHGQCNEVRFQYEDGNYYHATIEGCSDFSAMMQKLNDIIEAVVVLDNMNRNLQTDILRKH